MDACNASKVPADEEWSKDDTLVDEALRLLVLLILVGSITLAVLAWR